MPVGIDWTELVPPPLDLLPRGEEKFFERFENVRNKFSDFMVGSMFSLLLFTKIRQEPEKDDISVIFCQVEPGLLMHPSGFQ